MIAALSAALFAYWGHPGSPTEAAASSVSRLAEVASGDMKAALDTVAGSREEMEQIRKENACATHLAWVTVARSPGQPAGRIRLRSGTYVSPAFDLLDAPVRVAIPYPAPYPTGHGTISVLGATADAVVALTPPWRVPAQSGMRMQEVTWTPAESCQAPGK